MRDEKKTKAQFVGELAELRQRVVELEASADEREKAEEATRISDAILKEIPDAILFVDTFGAIRRWTGKAEQIFGYSADEAIGKQFSFLFRPEVREEVTTRFVNAVQEVDEFFDVIPCLRKDGYEVLTELTAIKVTNREGKAEGVLLIHKDVGGQKRTRKKLAVFVNELGERAKKGQKVTAEALACEQSLLRALMENLPDAVYFKDRDVRWLRVSDSLAELVNVRPEDVIGKTDADFFVKELADKKLEDDLGVMGSGKPIVGKEERDLTLEGKERWVSTTKLPWRNEDGNIVGLLGVSRDITERKEAEEALRESEQQYRTLGETIPYGVWLTDAIGYCTYVSVSFLEMAGMTMEQVQEFGWLHLLPPEEVQPTKEHWLQCVQTGEDFEREHRFRQVDGSFRNVLAIGRPIRDDTGKITKWVGLNLDISERRKTEQELIRLERMRASGELSAGVSHNLNNILTSVLGPAQLLKRMTDDPKLLREIEDIVASATRAKDLVRNLHQSARTVEGAKLEPVRVDSVIREAVQATRPRWKDESEARGVAIEVETQLGDVPTVRATESGLHEILMNLLFNAVDALPEGGRITAGTRSAGDRVELSLSDTGVGMDEATRSRVFEPFFTTKAEVGTGLGMSTAHAAVTRWGGTIDVESMPEEGTTFTIRLPVWEEAGRGS